MKKILMFLGMALILIGCKQVPTPEKMEKTAKAAGYTAGLVVKQTVTKEKSIDTITNIMTQVSTCVPTNGQTFVEAWTPVAQKYVDTLVEKNKITKTEGELVMLGVDLATSGIDYVFDKVYPKAREYEELVNAAVRGFTKGFMSNFDGSKDVIEVDDDLYKYLKEKIK